MDQREAEYWRGYGEGVYFRIRQRMGKSIREHNRLIEEATRKNDDSHVNAHARGYRDGYEGETLCPAVNES